MLARAGKDEREPGATFALGDIIWIDFESKSSLPIEVGTDRYASNADAIVLAWAIGDGPVHVSHVSDFPATLFWGDMPRELRDAFGQVTQGKMIFCAHNATFDRAIWNQSTLGFPTMLPKMMIDTRVQAAASGLPGKLEHAAKYAGAEIQKDSRGKDLIKLFCAPDTVATPHSHPDEWEDFLDYAAADIGAMRDLFIHTRQLPLAEWKEYWAAEAVNDGGVMIDIPMVEAAAKLAAADRVASAKELATLTGNAVTTVDQVARMIAWLNDVLPADGREILTKREEEIDIETGEVTKPRKEALDRDRVVKLLAYLSAQETLPAPLRAAERVLQIRLYGGSKTPAKFSKMLSMHVDGVIRHQYIFNGASQTGRASSRGIQLHNLARDPLPYELDAIDALVAGASLEEFAHVGDDTPVSRKLSLLIRPSLIAAPGRAFVWGDWANIEARITPWLADDAEADERLDVFEAVDQGREKYDIYTRTAATLSGLSLDEAKEPKIRQRGKVVELACLAADTRVLTDSGIKRITDINVNDRVWDGESWVGHQGLVARGTRQVMELDGVQMTPDHLVMSGKRWRPAKEVASNRDWLGRALAQGSANLPSSATNMRSKAASHTAARSAHAARSHISFPSTTSGLVGRSGATPAQRSSQATGAKASSATPISSLTRSIVAACSTALQRVKRAACLPVRPLDMPVMAFAASASSRSGASALRGGASFSLISSRSLAGTTPSLRWIVSMSTAITRRATSVLRHARREPSGLSKTSSVASTSLKPVFDIAHAGPRNRFTIMTDSGALLVHNCGFGGSTNALLSMAASYGMHLPEDEARAAVLRWREANPWAQRFWDALWDAAVRALVVPGVMHRAGMVGYIFMPGYLGGSLMCELPSGRFLTYRRCKFESVAEEDDDGNITGYKRELMFSREMGRIKLWPGLLCENITQAAAADLLRGTLRRLEEYPGLSDWMPTVLHTHDEVVVETKENRTSEAAALLRQFMTNGFDWTAGLPIAADTSIARFYTKSKASIGL